MKKNGIFCSLLISNDTYNNNCGSITLHPSKTNHMGFDCFIALKKHSGDVLVYSQEGWYHVLIRTSKFDNEEDWSVKFHEEWKIVRNRRISITTSKWPIKKNRMNVSFSHRKECFMISLGMTKANQKVFFTERERDGAKSLRAISFPFSSVNSTLENKIWHIRS